MNLTHITVGMLSDPAPTRPIDGQEVRSRVRLYLTALITAQKQMPGNPTITLLAGGYEHEVSKIVYEIAGSLGLDCRPGDGWGEPDSLFFEPCSMLFQLTDDEGAWCERQVDAYRASDREHAVHIML